ncbi:hypothetical protein [Candidatus Nitrosocosmicus arcticus]|uniref:Uncharacterized protein n=1 Tax=Candidatus Nitrosocosmicus arcticus TaxID=2035267 RepID=A0A557SZG9_9ARCH|nr:hypothetical protein [Candidatus Nitrosocosmicus arcticus]TVP41985.1 hypothetical protein NARC_10391 [Candidatus Nitrosocosmicus arcticus]
MSFSDIEKAGALTEVALQIQNSNGNLRTVYYKLEEILINYRKNNVDVDLIMPAIYEVDFEINKTNPDGRSVWVRKQSHYMKNYVIQMTALTKG